MIETKHKSSSASVNRLPDPPPGVRLAVVQHGDYSHALDVLSQGLPEPYFGMKDSVAVLEEFMSGVTHRVITVDAPKYLLQRSHGDVVGFHRPAWKMLSKVPWAQSVYRAVKEFRPTHLMLRTGGILAYPCLRYANSRSVSSLVIMAGYMSAGSWRERVLNRRLASLFNNPLVYRVANHRRPATLSTIRWGVDAAKAVSWDYRGLPHPRDATVRTLSDTQRMFVAFAGTICEGKGIGDLVDAIRQLHQQGMPIRLEVCGDGPLLTDLKLGARDLPEGAIAWHGRVGNDVVRRTFRDATVVCVPSRKGNSEGLPFTLTEALATRTPVICTNHPAVTELLCDGRGVRIVPSGDSSALARAIAEVCCNAVEYERLSRTTEEAFSKLDADLTFDQLLTQWRKTWSMPAAREVLKVTDRRAQGNER